MEFKLLFIFIYIFFLLLGGEFDNRFVCVRVGLILSDRIKSICVRA